MDLCVVHNAKLSITLVKIVKQVATWVISHETTIGLNKTSQNRARKNAKAKSNRLSAKAMHLAKISQN